LSYRDVQRAYRDSRWKVLRYPSVNVTQLFDLQQDPDERHDLSAEPEQAARVQDLLGRLAERQRQFGDTQPLQAAKTNRAQWTSSPARPAFAGFAYAPGPGGLDRSGG
jgi:arylsulfatase A-like enzyme